MDILGEFMARTPEHTQTGLMLLGFIQMVACLWVARFMKPPKR
jgi:hypothetical protein